MERRKGREASPEAKSETFTCPQTPKMKKNKIENKRRFSDEQIRSLELIFESETTKLEPRKKLQLAKELGMQPRQVAIWFQNKRARWRSKQIEHDYEILRAKYDRLASGFESLKKEKESLLLELQTLNKQLEKHEDENKGINDLKRISYTRSSKKGNTKSELEQKLSFLEEGRNHDNGIEIGQYDSVVPSEKWYGSSFNSGGILDSSTSSGTSHWLNFWV